MNLPVEDLSGYRYSIYATNLDLPVKELWNIYNGRADCENLPTKEKTPENESDSSANRAAENFF